MLAALGVIICFTQFILGRWSIWRRGELCRGATRDYIARVRVESVDAMV